jgi:transcriptional regulator with XRE-family HTH domain
MTAMAEQRQRTDFFDLVRERRAELGISLRELEARAIDPESGEQAKRAWVSKVEKGTAESPSEPMIRALAAGLNLPVRVVAEAASIQFFGMGSFVWSEDRTTRVLAARIEEMTDEERRQLADIAETFARRRTQGDGKA